jgi:4'-phosphopantetheinyl transferase
MGERNETTAASATDLQPIAFDHANVRLWLATLARTSAEVEELAGWLSPAERARAQRFGTDALRERWIAGRTTLRLLLGSVLGVAPAAVEIRRGIRGRPELADPGAGVDFNVSHTGDAALVGIARALPPRTRIGIDIERRDRDVGVDRLARKFLTANERATLAGLDLRGRRERFLRYWTCKEAMSKATGDGLIAPFGRLDVAQLEDPRLASGPPPYVPDRWTLHAVAVPAPWFATVAIWHAPE